ncbi:MAG TPA: hypothetical protein VFE29_01030 [Terriglobia bacterium]|nr:hypothetical protein [Terriglobia bacterium]
MPITTGRIVRQLEGRPVFVDDTNGQFDPSWMALTSKEEYA